MKQRQLTYEEELDFFDQYEAVVYYCLSRLNIYPNHNDFDDLAQIARLELVGCYEHFDYDSSQEDFAGRFVGYAKYKIRWRLIDQLRKANRIQQAEFSLDPHSPMQIESRDPWGDVNQQIDLERYQSLLSEDEKLLLKKRYAQDKSMVKIAEELGVSRQTLYRRKRALMKKLTPLKEA